MELSRLLWACRRGMLELDLLLQPYAKEVYPELSLSQQSEFETLLNLEDQLLFDWFMDKKSPEPKFVHLVSEIKSYAQRSL
jgi:antitoxin CptB